MAPGWWIIPGAALGALFWVLTACTVAGVIWHDRGGPIATRAAEIAVSPPVEIRGYCASACTMHLANGCVSPTAVLVFHGPQGTAPGRFDFWSSMMAAHYPPQIDAAFMAEWRFTTHRISGAQAIAMGATECARR